MLGENFTFDGIPSSTYSMKSIRTSGGGFLTETLIGSANIMEVEHPNDFKPHLQKITRTPIEFTKQFALLDAYDRPKDWTEVDRQLIANWLFHNEYKPITFSDRPNIVYNVIASANLNLNTINSKGYVEITFRSNSPYAWKAVREIILPAGTTTSSSIVIAIDNYIAVDKIYPTILLERETGITSATNVQGWTATPTVAEAIGVSNALIPTVNKVYINSKYRSITNFDTRESLYRYKGTTGFDFPYLIKGNNTFYASKGWKATIKFQEPIIY